MADLDLATAQSYYSAAVAAKQALLTGAQAVEVQHGPNRKVTYSAINLAALDAWIQELNSMIGRATNAPRRGPIGMILS